MSDHDLPPLLSINILPSPSLDFDLQTKLYANRPLPDPPPFLIEDKHHKDDNSNKSVKRKPLRPDASVVGAGAALETSKQKEHAAQGRELDALSGQGRTLSSGASDMEHISPPPKSPLRYASYTPSETMSPKRAAHQRCSSAKVHQLTGIDIDVCNDNTSWNRGAFLMDDTSEDSEYSVYSEESTNQNSTMRTWHTTTDDVPALETDQDGNSSRVTSWEPKSPPAITVLQPNPSLRRKVRTKRIKSQDRHVLDNYHRIVTDLASPSSSMAMDILTAIPPKLQLRPVQGSTAFQRTDGDDDGMPSDFHIMLSDPRRAPRPPPNAIGPDGERLRSYFDNSDSEDSESDGIFFASGRGRDSFLAMLLGRGSGEDEAGQRQDHSSVDQHHNHLQIPHEHSRSASDSTGAGRPSSELGDGLPEFAGVAAVDPVRSYDNKKKRRSGSRRAALKGLVEEWTKKDGSVDVVDEAERRRQELKQKITVHGGRRV